MNNILQMAQQMRQNPSQITQMLYQNGKINKEQFEQMQGLNSPQEIGQFLLNNNILPSNQFQQLQQQAQAFSGFFKR